MVLFLFIFQTGHPVSDLGSHDLDKHNVTDAYIGFNITAGGNFFINETYN